MKYGEPLLFKPQNVCKRSGRIKVLSITNKVEDDKHLFEYGFFFSLSGTRMISQILRFPPVRRQLITSVSKREFPPVTAPGERIVILAFHQY